MAQARNRPDASGRDLGSFLVERGRLTTEALNRAMRVRAETGERLNVILTKLGLVSDRDMAQALAALLGLPLIGRDAFPEEPVLEAELGAGFVKESRIMPLAVTADEVSLAMADPLDAFVVNAVRLATNRAVKIAVALPAEIEAAVAQVYGGDGRTIEAIFAGDADLDESAAASDTDVEKLRDLAAEAPVIRFVNHMICPTSAPMERIEGFS